MALALDPYKDYHWYRQNSDGTWSHKVGDHPVTNLDTDQVVIWDPSMAIKFPQKDMTIQHFLVFITFIHWI